jgi:hypothetical protein
MLSEVDGDNDSCLIPPTQQQQQKSSRLSYSEARAYLELADWDVNAALTSIQEDLG